MGPKTVFVACCRNRPAHAVDLLLNTEIRLLWGHSLRLYCVLSNATHQYVERAALSWLSTVKQCRWTLLVATCQAQSSLTSVALAHDYPVNPQTLPQIPFRKATSGRLSVVACFSPLFYFERWQTLILALEIYRQQGVSLQVFYVQSILTDILNVIELYARRRHATVQLWPQLDIRESDLGYNPNNQLVFRNQASAHTDCILQYKMAADFIIISDIDELLFPTDGLKLPEYFAGLLAKAPLSSSFQYRRFNAEFNSSVRISDFSLSALLSGTKITNEEVHTKAVVLPSRVHIMGPHYPLPQHIVQGYNSTAVPESDNIIVHFRKWNGIDRDSNHSILRGGVLTTKERGPHKTHAIKRFVKRPDAIEAEFRKFFGDADSETILSSLPREAVYYRLFEKCYDEIWYDKPFKQHDRCPGPILCDVPPVDGYSCFVSRVRFVRQSIGSDVVLHYSESGAYGIRVKNGCVA